MFCSVCGTKLPNDAIACYKCASPVGIITTRPLVTWHGILSAFSLVVILIVLGAIYVYFDKYHNRPYVDVRIEAR